MRTKIAPGTRLGHYEVQSLLGTGGMGEVYRARDSRLHRDVAVKVLPGDFAADADRLRRFEQEARATGQLNHPNIVAIYDLGTSDGNGGTPFIVTELLEGQSLRAVVGQSGDWRKIYYGGGEAWVHGSYLAAPASNAASIANRSVSAFWPVSAANVRGVTNSSAAAVIAARTSWPSCISRRASSAAL